MGLSPENRKTPRNSSTDTRRSTPLADCCILSGSTLILIRSNVRRISLAIWVLAFAIRLTLVFGFERQELGRPEPVRIAVSLAKNGAFADPYEIPTGPTAHTAPL